MTFKNNKLFIFIIVLVPLISCQKFLNEKPDKKLVVPKTIADFQALMDNHDNMNRETVGSGETSSDNFYLPDDYYNAIAQWERNLYVWDKESIPNGAANDWGRIYLPIYYSNIVLEGVQDIERTALNGAEWDNLKGSALFYRSKYFFDAILIWAKAYDKSTASTDLGIPLRFSLDFNEQSFRSSVQECYDRIITDLKESENLLPQTPQHVMRPSKPAAYALLARVYLSMRDYDNAFVYADKCLQIKSELIDFNAASSDFIPTSSFPIQRFNREVIMHFRMSNTWWIPGNAADTLLMNSYASNDIRGSFFFEDNGDGTYNSYKSSYDPDYFIFSGFATDEMYLTRAECFARKGNTTAALNDLNNLLMKRYDATFVAVTATDAPDALQKILVERRKELVIRGTRWMDIKRLNKEGANITLTRVVNGQTYTLPPNDNRYALPIPNDIIEISGMQQNPR